MALTGAVEDAAEMREIELHGRGVRRGLARVIGTTQQAKVDGLINGRHRGRGDRWKVGEIKMIALRTWLTTHPRHAATIGILVAAVIVLLAVYLRGRDDARKHEEAARAVAVAEALKGDGKAKAKVAEVREHDAQVNAKLREELTDAVSEVPDDVPDPVAVRLGCERLRAHGVSVANLPACR